MLHVQVDVHVHQARHDGVVAQVDDRIVSAAAHEAVVDGYNPVVFDDDGDARSGFVGDAVDECTRVDVGLRGRDSRADHERQK